MGKFLLTAVCLVGCVSTSWAKPIAFKYESTTDATNVGGSSTAPVSLIFTFDSDLANETGANNLALGIGSYGPWSGILKVGSEVAEFTGGTIDVYNNQGFEQAGSGREPHPYDLYLLQWNGTSSGDFFGSNLSFLQLALTDYGLNMLSSAELPTDPSFATENVLIRDRFGTHNGEFGVYPLPISKSFTLTSVPAIPEPETYAMLLAGLGVLGWRLRRA